MRYRGLCFALGAILAIPPAHVWAQAQPAPTDERQEIKDELQLLRKRMDDLERRLEIADQKAVAAEAEKARIAAADAEKAKLAAAATPATAAAAPAALPLVAAEAPVQTASAGAVPYVSADTTGFTIRSADGNFLLKIGADLQVDNRTYFGAGSTSLTDSILLRRVRPTFSGTVYKYVEYFFRPDFGLGTTVIYDAYIQLNYIPHLSLRVGKFKPPVGLERLQSDDDTSLIERGLPTLLAPSRDIGYELLGDFLRHRVGYQVGVFNGVVDNSLSDAAVSNHRDYAGRLFLTPFAPAEKSPLQGLGFGLAATAGGVSGLGLPAYKTVGQNTFFTFASGVSEQGHRTRLAPQTDYYLGPVGLLAEYGVNEEGLQKAQVRHNFAFRAWQVTASYILTGESKSFLSPTPRHPFDPLNNSWGAVELAFRSAEFSADHALFGYGFASPTATPREAREYIGGVNWYLNRLVRLSADYGVTGFEGGAALGDRVAERVLLLRIQINFI